MPRYCTKIGPLWGENRREEGKDRPFFTQKGERVCVVFVWWTNNIFFDPKHQNIYRYIKETASLLLHVKTTNRRARATKSMIILYGTIQEISLA